MLVCSFILLPDVSTTEHVVCARRLWQDTDDQMGETSFNEFNIAVFGLRVNVKSSCNNTSFGVVASVVVITRFYG